MIKLFAVLVSAFLAGSASAAPHGILWADGQKALHIQKDGKGDATKTTGLQYYGGPVISNAKIYAVFWGDNVPAETKTKIGPFFASMVDSVYMDWLKEYATNLNAVDGRAGTNQTIGRGTFGGAITIKPAIQAKDLLDADVQKELEAQIAAGKLPKQTDDSLYMVYFPAGVSIAIEGEKSCSSFCAYHEGFKAAGGSIFYGVMPVCGGWGCGGGFDSMTAVSSHEAIEAITDPFPTPGSKPAYPQAWNDSQGEEISDLCASESAKLTAHGVTSSVSGQWKNSIKGCFNGPWQSTVAGPAEAFAALAARKPGAPLMASLAAPMCWDGAKN